MIKFAVILVLLAIGIRWAFGQWPWDYLRSETDRSRRLNRARRLLDVPASAGETEIRAAHRKMAAVLHPDRGGTDARLAEINAARDLLLEELSTTERDTLP